MVTQKELDKANSRATRSAELRYLANNDEAQWQVVIRAPIKTSMEFVQLDDAKVVLTYWRARRVLQLLDQPRAIQYLKWGAADNVAQQVRNALQRAAETKRSDQLD